MESIKYKSDLEKLIKQGRIDIAHGSEYQSLSTTFSCTNDSSDVRAAHYIPNHIQSAVNKIIKKIICAQIFSVNRDIQERQSLSHQV